MTKDALLKILDDVASGRLSTADAAGALEKLPFEELGFAKVDHHRALRRGFPEVIFAQGKSVEQIRGLLEKLWPGGEPVLVTRLSEEKASGIVKDFPDGVYDAVARTFHRGRMPEKGRGSVVILTAGTSDIPVAEEAAVTARVLGNTVETIYDVGVAGLHRLAAAREAFDRATAIVVVAGMEGALASVVSGLVRTPVIGVPTSVGYGAHFGGIAALLSMLNSCSGGVSVVNIDNGYGAAVVATLINRSGK
ncbi:MAG: nickel pincer cofactor biosynthesis protein LarB [Deltaproteobacteria bacterium]|nr:nickel pincer cofactor biosynthesis protein LarB [Deltaproteobacteria bacterium]